MRTAFPVAVAALLAAAPAASEAPPSGAITVKLAVGERLDLCAAKLIPVCPVSRFICDDPKVATVELTQQGIPAGLVGVGAGQTLCAVYDMGGANKRLLAVSVAKPAGR